MTTHKLQSEKLTAVLGTASTIMIVCSAFFIAAPVLNLLDPMTAFPVSIAAFAACTVIDAVRRKL